MELICPKCKEGSLLPDRTEHGEGREWLIIFKCDKCKFEEIN